MQKNKEILKTQSQKQELQLLEQRNTLNRKSEFFLVDSSHSDFTMQLWPKGKFTFSVAKGFEGEAEKMVIKGRHSSQKLITAREESQQDSTRIAAKYSQLKETSTIVKKKKLNFGYSWTWVLLIPGFYILYLCYKSCGLQRL